MKVAASSGLCQRDDEKEKHLRAIESTRHLI